MTAKKIRKKILKRKFIMNLLLKFLKPTNKLMVKLSQNLDKDISRYQMILYKLHVNKTKNNRNLERIAA
ncbi:hypothetical protein BH721_04605 [Clostridium baratii]|uniref:Uncharacterized protein n=1 Tax=Clostridium baratii TaxID=1561 RepID=A0A174TLN2_9CLOT|nr:hypothetical protein [Clostridium baratii]OPF52541.1 hypothetical protein A1M12_10810 [Clostridium baratii]OPF55989.1 hypothetical protein BH721_04605 [Clostridium baratii]OPF58417.1 hypothetical protein BH724_05975 [Clostridium baratii]OPF59629.1 hypothetical protein BH725_03320 [Clostridium baratii]CUQ08768.1 Uncharacterised protein [Clostridium baratii]